MPYCIKTWCSMVLHLHLWHQDKISGGISAFDMRSGQSGMQPGNLTATGLICLKREPIILGLQDYRTPEGKVLSRDLTHQLNTAIQFLVECRPLSVSMGNAIKYLKLQVIPPFDSISTFELTS